MTTECRVNNLRLIRKTESGQPFLLEIDELGLSCKAKSEGKIPIKGKSGAGKSTLLNALASISRQESGSIQWSFPASSDMFRWDEKDQLPDSRAHLLRRQFFGFVFQSSSLLPYCSISDNLIYPQLLIGTPRREAEKVAKDLLRQTIPDKAYPELSSRLINQLSGGERQRVALAQALVNNPYVLFADEPAGSLDRATRDVIMRMLYDWVDENDDRLLLWVTHHEDDPVEAGVSRYIHVADNRGEWRAIDEK